MSVRRKEPSRTGAAKTRPAAPADVRDDAHPSAPGGDAKQPYATEIDDYQGGKAKPPEEKPNSAPKT
ncbi:MAG TPA: hypothetical protein VGH40_15310 [Roseiarcus sp.]|jgi:hypothetical protein